MLGRLIYLWIFIINELFLVIYKKEFLILQWKCNVFIKLYKY